MNVPLTPMKLSHRRQIMMKEVPKLDSCVSVTTEAMRKITKNVSCEFYLISVMLVTLTVTVRDGSRLPKSSKMLITVDLSIRAQK